MRSLLLASLLLLPAVAMADEEHCQFHADRSLDLDLRGVRSIRFATNSHDLHVSGGAASGKGTVRGRACASDEKALDNLVVTQQRDGDTLLVELTNKRDGWSGFGSHYAYLKIDANVPADIPVQLNVGSGDATATGITLQEGNIGSGDLDARDVKGPFRGKVGSGDLKMDGTGPLDIDTVGSGDFTARRVKGAVRIGSVGSGDARLIDVTGNVEVGTLGSGDLDVDGVRGDLSVRSVGSGDVEHKGVTGKVDVPQN